jgi:AcrR family transcriptional regulator
VTSAAPQPGLRERKKAQTRAAFIDAGLELFARRGYHEVTVEDICAIVDVSPRTFFRYFATKADLVIAEMDRLLGGLLSDLRARPDSETAWSALGHALGAVCEVITNRRAPYLALYAVTQDAPELVAGNAAALLEWEQQMSAEVARRLPSAVGRHARLMTGIALTVFRVSTDEWAAGDGRDDLATTVAEKLSLLRPAAQRLARG